MAYRKGTAAPAAGVRQGRSRPRARRLPPAQRRAHLLACALRVFAQRGLGAATHADIAAEAGVAASTVFFYFPSRAALVEAALDEVERFLVEMAERIHQGEAPVPEVVLAHARAFAASVDTHPDHIRVWIHWSTAIGSDTWPRYLAFQDRVLAILSRTFARGRREGALAPDLDPDDDARILVGAAHMVAQMKLARSSPETVERFLRALARATMGAPPSAG